MMSLPESTFDQDIRIAEALLEISHNVGSVMEIEDILSNLCSIAARVMGTDTCSIYLRDEDNPEFLVLQASHGLNMSPELGVRGFNIGQGIPGVAAKQNKTLVVSDARHHPDHKKLDDTEEEHRFVSYICTPLRIQHEVIGVQSVRRADIREWTHGEILFAEIIAKQAAIVLEKKRLYTEKVEAERLAAIAISLSEVAHYIKNILTSIQGGAFLLDSGIKRNDMEKIESGWGMLKRSNKKIRSLVENMLLFSRKQVSQKEEADLNDIISEVAEEIEETAMQRNIQVSMNLQDTLPLMLLDKDALHDVILNIATNALDAIPENEPGEVNFESYLDSEKNSIILRIADSGMGIPEEARAKLFKLFFSTKGRRGTGIGLAVCKKIVEEHEGKIFFETAEGEGTRFTISLPIGS